MLAVPQTGDLLILTEFGRLHVQPREIVVVQVGLCGGGRDDWSFLVPAARYAVQCAGEWA